MTAVIQSNNVLQHRIMVAETVKSYPANYPALIPLSPSVAGLGGYNPCTSSLLHAGYSPTHMMDQKPPQQQQQSGNRQDSPVGGPHSIPDSPVGLGAPGLNLPSSFDLAAQIRKKEMFVQRKQREFIPDNKKDDSYWDRRRRNNEAAKRSREKRRFNDMILERRVVELSQENHLLKAQLSAIKDKYGIQGESLINVDQVKASMPQPEQVLAANKRAKLNNAIMSLGSSPSVTSLLSPEGCDPNDSPQSFHGQQDAQSPQYHLYPPSTPQMDDDPSYDTSFQQYGASNGDLNYGQSALNLSAHPSSPLSHSPPSPAISHMEYSPSEPELCRRSPEAGMSLPHKLRHKSHLGDKDAAQSLLALHTIKSEPNEHHQEAAEDSVGSSDERDSGISFSSSSSCSDNSSSPTTCVMVNGSSSQHQQQPLNMSHFHHQQSSHSPQHQPQQQHHTEGDNTSDYENTHLRSELERLATEVATLKYMLVRRPRSETDSDGSR